MNISDVQAGQAAVVKMRYEEFGLNSALYFEGIWYPFTDAAEEFSGKYVKMLIPSELENMCAATPEEVAEFGLDDVNGKVFAIFDLNL